ncbi:MAG: CRISPR-associated endonuclease Cas2 [Zetaproteobacteria bacterium]|nr:MAG: CRISPR-associated endonuclease Cas2 [Zetaproteobacteria bacterium]
MPLNAVRPYLICYDIADPRRLQRLHKLVSREAVMVQYSVYYAELNANARDRLVTQLRAMCNPNLDDIRLYPLPQRTRVVLYGAHGIEDTLPGAYFAR